MKTELEVWKMIGKKVVVFFVNERLSPLAGKMEYFDIAGDTAEGIEPSITIDNNVSSIEITWSHIKDIEVVE